MIKKIKSEKGITITTLVITVILMMIMTMILAKNARTTMQVSNLTRLQTDIEALNDRISAYYVKNNRLPIIDESRFCV